MYKPSSFCFREIYRPYYGRIAERVIYMCKVYEFPVKKQLPEEVEKGLQKLAKDYIQLMDKALKMFDEDDLTEEDFNDFMEQVILIYAEATANAIDEV